MPCMISAWYQTKRKWNEEEKKERKKKSLQIRVSSKHDYDGLRIDSLIYLTNLYTTITWYEKLE